MARRLDRITQLLPCRMQVGCEQHGGEVTDLTSDGLFIATDATLRPGTQVVIQIEVGDGVPELALRAIVVRIRLVREGRCQLVSHGVGLRVLQAPDAYYQLAESKGRVETAAADEKFFQVRVREKGKSSYRSLRVIATSAENAREQIVEEIGPDWEVTGVDEEQA